MSVRPPEGVTVGRPPVGHWRWVAFGLLCVATALFAAAAAGATATLVIEPAGHAGPIRRIAADPASDLLVTTSDDRTARVWELSTGRLLRTLRPPVGDGPVGKLYGAALRPGTRTVAVAGGADPSGRSSPIFFFDVDSGRMLRRIDTGRTEVKRLRWSPDGALLAACFAGTDGLRVFDADGSTVFDEAFSGPCYGLAFGHGGRLAATETPDRVRLYAATDGRVAPRAVVRTEAFDPVDVAFSPDGGRFAVGYQRGRLMAAHGISGSSGDLRYPFATVHGSASGESLGTPQLPNDPDGNLWAVAWSPDGTTLYAGGRATLRPEAVSDFVVAAFSADGYRLLSTIAVARAALTDFAPLDAARVAWAAFDGGWGVADPREARRVESPRIADLRGPAELRVNESQGRIRWTFERGRQPAVFEPAARVLRLGDDRGADAAAVRHGLFGADNRFENTLAPVVNGGPIKLGFGEASRALACLPRSSDCVLGSSHTLRRIGPGGQPVWTVAVDSETWAVNVWRNGQGLVTAHADGTIRWWRASDGRRVLTLHADPDGRWIAWTPQGFFDASEGGERLAGWTVDRGPAVESDFFTLGRFRDTYLRPDIVDRVLETLDDTAAVAESNRIREERARAEAAQLPPARAIEPATLPPAVLAAGSALLPNASATVRLPFSIRSAGGRPIGGVQVRVNAIRDDSAQVALPSTFDGTTRGEARVDLPPGESVIEILASDDNGVSEPLSFVARRPAAAPGRAPRGKLYVLAVGVGRFRDATIEPLGFAAKDADDFTTAIRAAAPGAFESIEIRTRRDADATTRALLDDIDWLVRSATPADTVVVFLSGHGTTDDLDRYHFITHDARRDRLSRTALDGAALKARLAAVKGRALLLLDTCKAGTIVSTALPGKQTATSITNSMSAPEIGVVVFSAGTGRQLALYREEWNNSAFTKIVVEGIRGKAGDPLTREVTHRRLGTFVTREVRVLTADDQRPVVVAPPALGDFALGLVSR